MGYRQEVLNVVLAQVLQERGIISSPEDVLTFYGHRKMPDLLVNYYGLRTVIEAEVCDQADAEDKALQSVTNRVNEGISQIGIALVYPASLRSVSFSDLHAALVSTPFKAAVVTEAGKTSYAGITIDTLAEILRHAFDQLVREDVVKRAVAELEHGIEQFSYALSSNKTAVRRAAQSLGIQEVTDKQLKEASDVSGLVLLNAFIFQEILAQHDLKVKSLQQLAHSHSSSDYCEHWQFILDNINYYPIFHVACEVLLSLPVGISADISILVKTAQSIVSMKAALRHDLMGRVYHRLLLKAKYLGTYYTSIPAATLLLRLAFRKKTFEWENIDLLREYRIADLSCGTGTLLMAAADAMVDCYIRSCVAQGKTIDLPAVERILLEDVLYGFDVLLAAIHLSASTLALRAPDTCVKKTNLYSLPLGGVNYRLGSIEFLSSNNISRDVDLFTPHDLPGADTIERASGSKNKGIGSVSLPPLDLCVMNPPFVRSVGGNLLFGSSPDEERKKMQGKLQRLLKQNKVSASSTAGLGSVFTAIGDRYIKSDGQIALVLPKTLLSGVAWGKTRDLLRKNYKVDYLISSHDPERWNFSETTNLSEVLVVAHKQKNGSDAPDTNTTVVNLSKNVTTMFESLVVEKAIPVQAPALLGGQGISDIRVGLEKVGESFSVPWEELRVSESWMWPAAFAQSDAVRAARYLHDGEIYTPGCKDKKVIPLTTLGALGTLGPDRRDIKDAFVCSSNPTPYAAFWGHDSEAITTMAQAKNCHLTPLAEALTGRTLRLSTDLWPRAGNVLFSERVRLNTCRLVAIRTSEKVLSNMWWTFSLHEGKQGENMEKALMMWLNSTLGLYSLLSERQETEGAWVDFKKPTLERLQVLNVEKLSKRQLVGLAHAYDVTADLELLPLLKMADDAVRSSIDKAISSALGLPDLSSLRQMLAREPVICLKRL